jgi:hypothetical protein
MNEYNKKVYIYIYVYIYICSCIYLYIYIYVCTFKGKDHKIVYLNMLTYTSIYI